MEECALFLTVDVIVHSGCDRVQVSRIGIVRSLVRAAQFFRVDAAVLQVLVVPGVDVRRCLGPSRLPGEGAGQGEDVVVRGTTRERRFRKTKLFAVAPIRHLENSPHCRCVQ